jgi:hypothetical protein
MKWSVEKAQSLYWDEGLGSHQVAEWFGVSHMFVIDSMARAGVETRPRGREGSNTREEFEAAMALRENCEELVRLYCEEALPISKIATMCREKKETTRRRLIDAGCAITLRVSDRKPK